MKWRNLLGIVLSVSMLPAVGAVNMPAAEAADDAVKVKLDPAEAAPYEFEGWGTSLGWWGNRIGYSDKMSKQAAEMFFSENGLGLDIVRYNVGGGDDPTHNHVTRSDSKLPCYAVPEFNADGTLKRDGNGDVIYSYNWDNDYNQVSVLKAIKAQNNDVHIEGYTNSPPWFMTISGCSGGGTNPGDENLDPENYDIFTKFLGDVTEHMAEEGLKFDSYSPMNEPAPVTQYWTALNNKQEGNLVAQGAHQSALFKALKDEYNKRGIDTLVVGADETDATLAANGIKSLTAEGLASLDRVDTHTYGYWNSTNDRTAIRKAAAAAGKKLWMSECDGGWAFWGLADQIIKDMNMLQPSAWCMWDIVDRHRDADFTAPDGTTPEKDAVFNPEDGLWGVGLADHDTEEILLANKYYAYGQFTKYIVPGDTIIASSAATLAAYNKDSGDIKIVVSNDSDTDRQYSFDLSAFTKVGTGVTEIRSNNETGAAAEHWAKISGEASVKNKVLNASSKAKSVTTFIVNGEGAPNYAVIKGGADELSLGSNTALTLATDIEGDVKWSVSDTQKAEITDTGSVYAKESGSITVTAEVGGFTVSREFTIPQFSISGTPSWGNSSNRPSDDADYLKAADGDLSTFFDGNQNGWIMYDCNTPYKLSGVKLAPRSGYTDRSVGGEVQASDDGMKWTTLYKVTSALADGKYTELTAAQLGSPKAYRYYRYTNPDNMTNIAEFTIDGAVSADTPENAAAVRDIPEFTDSFEGDGNIFGADKGTLEADGNQVFETNLARFGSAFAPVKATASAVLENAAELTAKDKFRIRFDMFSGWEQNGKGNTFAIKDKDGNEIFAFYITGGGYTLSEVRIGGKNVLDGTRVAQCRSNPGSNKSGANGWGASGQPYVNNMGYNKTVEIIIDGQGNVSASLTGGMEDIEVSGALAAPVSVGSIELTGSYNSSRSRVTAYDNFDADIISYASELEAPTQTPGPTEAPVIPENGELININFEQGDLTSSSDYGRASGTPGYLITDGKACAKFDGTKDSVITLTDANGNGLLTGQKNITISFKVKPTGTATSWWFFAAPDDTAQTYQKEKYLGIMTGGGNITVERYNNNGSRSTAVTGSCPVNEWNSVTVSINDNSTSLYINGTEAGTVASTVNIADMLGSDPVVYIGRANWGGGEYASGYIDDFVIKTGAIENPLSSLDLGDTTEVTGDIAIPSIDGVSWSSSDESIVGTDGKVTPADDTRTVTLTASCESGGLKLQKSFEIRVIGNVDFSDSFAAYYEDGMIKYTSLYNASSPYDMYVALKDENGILVSVKLNEATGEFTGIEDGKTYSVICFVWDGKAAAKNEAAKRTVKASTGTETSAYLFAHFVGTEENESCEQIYFSVSEDGTTWTTLNNKQPVLTSTVGEQGVRDPYILRGEDGRFFVIATDLSICNRKKTSSNAWGECQNAGSKSIVIWESEDLVNWSEASLVEVAPDNAGCTWAPECVYDSERGEYMVFWASKTADDGYRVQRIYRAFTKDFRTFSEPEIYIDTNVGDIDTTIVKDKGIYYRFTKNESKSSVTMMKSATLDGPWTDVYSYKLNGAAGNTVTGYEGPTVYKLNGTDNWCMLLDLYSKSAGYKPFTTTDIKKGEFVSASDFSFDDKYRHGTVMPITAEEYDRLTQAYQKSQN